MGTLDAHEASRRQLEHQEKTARHPAGPEAEQALLGALILQPERIAWAHSRLPAQALTTTFHRCVWAALVALDAARLPVDYVSLLQELAGKPPPDEGWGSFLLGLGAMVSSPGAVAHHLELVRDAFDSAEARKVLMRGHADMAEARRGTGDVLATIDAIVDELGSVARARMALRPGSAAGAAGRALLARMDEHRDALFLGLPPLDSLLGGLEAGNVLVLAARPSVGKSSVAIQVALNVARDGKSVLFVSLEMSVDEVAERMLANIARVDSHAVRQRRVIEPERARLRQAADQLDGMRIEIHEGSNMPVQAVRAIARGMRELDLIVVDYLQLLSSPDHARENRTQEVSAISRGLKWLAKDLGIPIIALAQLSRAGVLERPALHHLRESGTIEQDADQVGLLYTEEGHPDRLVLDLAKNRHGPKGECFLHFERSTCRLVGMPPPDAPL